MENSEKSHLGMVKFSNLDKDLAPKNHPDSRMTSQSCHPLKNLLEKCHNFGEIEIDRKCPSLKICVEVKVFFAESKHQVRKLEVIKENFRPKFGFNNIRRNKSKDWVEF